MNRKKNQRILLIGGRSKAKSMAASLLGQGYQVTAINVSYEDCVMLAELKGLNVIHGDGTKPYILDEAGAAQCDIAIALSSRDTDNLVACQLCKKLASRSWRCRFLATLRLPERSCGKPLCRRNPSSAACFAAMSPSFPAAIRASSPGIRWWSSPAAGRSSIPFIR